MNCLFELNTEPISLTDLENAEFDFFKGGYLLNDSYNETILKYYNAFYNKEENVPFYHCLPAFNTITNDKSFRFFVVDICGALYFIAYKIIQIIKTKQIRVFDLPIAIDGNIDNTRKVFEILNNKPFIKFAMSDYATRLLNVQKNKRLVEYTNYYYTRQATDLIPRKKIKHWGIKTLQENKDFNVVILDKIPQNDTQAIVNDFNKYLVERGSFVSKKDNDEFCAFCRGYDNIKLLCIYYKSILISVCVLYVFGNVAYNLYQKDLKHYDTQDPILDKMLRYNMEQKTKFLCFKHLPNVKRIYILGCMPSEKRLIKHKEMCSDGKIEYLIY